MYKIEDIINKNKTAMLLDLYVMTCYNKINMEVYYE